MSILPTPDCFGLPDKYLSWRPYQEQAILNALDNEKRFTTQILPTGSGKSLLGIATALMRGGRVLYLTSTKGLQRQLLNDFHTIGLVDIRGRNSYACRAATDGSMCDHGPCISGYKCPLKGGGCLYFDAYEVAKHAPLVVSNYSYWMSITKYGEGLGDFNTIICDEAHNSPDVVSSFMTITIHTQDAFVSSLLSGGFAHFKLPDWKEWAREKFKVVEDEIAYLLATDRDQGGLSKEQRKDLVHYKKLKKSMEGIANMSDDWLWEWEDYNGKVSFSPVWPAAYCERYLFQGIEHVILTSATVNEKTVQMLGVNSADSVIYEYPHTFPLENRLLIHIPTIRLNFRSSPADLEKWRIRIDQIIAKRLDRKGIIHTVSYDRRNMIQTNSKYANIMMTHKSRNTEFMVQKFKDTLPPKVFLSPAVTTGYDFYGDACEYQIIGKLPYPNTRNAILKERTKRDKEYAPYITMQQLIQMVGRAVRSPIDRCESFIIDNNIVWFLNVYNHLAPDWFKGAFISRTVIPAPPKKIRG